MSQEINLTSSEWTDIVFEGRNKEYGAYVIRQTSSKRHILALLIVIILLVIIATLPALIKAVVPEKYLDHFDESTVVSTVDILKPDEPVVPIEDVQPPVKVKPTITFTPPEITEERIDDKDKMRTQEELAETRAVIATTTHEGTFEEGAVFSEEAKTNNGITQTDDNKIFLGVEQMPQFPGGDAELMKYLSKNIHYPTLAAENYIQGRVTLRFVVEKNGEVSQVEILKGLDPSCDKEAVRVVKAMPKWIPGKQNGRNVSVYYTLPVIYKLR